MFKRVFQILSVFILGVIGGMMWQAILLPYLAKKPAFERLWFIEDFKDGETIIYPKEEIYIKEETAITEAVEKAEKMVVGIKTETKKGKIIEGSGLILTSDGLVVTLAELLEDGSHSSFFVNDQSVPFTVQKVDTKKNFALVKIEKEGLATDRFADVEKIKRGEKVFLVGIIFLNEKPIKITNQGIIKYFDASFIRTNIFEKDILKGSVLFDVEGKVLGINTIDLEGKVTAIPISEIQQFAGF